MPDTESTTRQALGLVFSNGLVAFALVPLAIFAFSFFGRHIYVAELISNFRLQILLVMLPCVVLLFSCRKWSWGIVTLIAAAWSTAAVLGIYLPADQPPAGPQKIKIMSFNVFTGNRSSDLVIERINEADPDVIAILEYDSVWVEQLRQLDQEYPHQILEPRWHGYGVAIFSRYPLGNSQIYQLTAEKTDVPLLIANLDAGQTKIQLAAVHVFSPTSWPRLELRNRQLQEIANLLGTNRTPTVVIGDFNSTPWSVFLSDFLKETGLRDSRQGFGFHASWNTKFPLVRVPIDHAFVSPDISVHDRYVAKSAGSDHFPIVIEVSVAQ